MLLWRVLSYFTHFSRITACFVVCAAEVSRRGLTYPVKGAIIDLI